MIYNFFFKCLINMNNNYSITLKKIEMYPITMMLFHWFLHRITTSSIKTLFLHKYLTGKKIKISTSSHI